MDAAQSRSLHTWPPARNRHRESAASGLLECLDHGYFTAATIVKVLLCFVLSDQTIFDELHSVVLSVDKLVLL